VLITKTSRSKFFTDLNFVTWENHTELSDPCATTNVTFWYQVKGGSYTVASHGIHCAFYWPTGVIVSPKLKLGTLICLEHFVFEFPCIISLYNTKNQQDATLAVLFISHCKITLHVSDAFCVHHQEY
jgi:hypothetical protein